MLSGCWRGNIEIHMMFEAFEHCTCTTLLDEIDSKRPVFNEDAINFKISPLLTIICLIEMLVSRLVM